MQNRTSTKSFSIDRFDQRFFADLVPVALNDGDFVGRPASEALDPQPLAEFAAEEFAVEAVG